MTKDQQDKVLALLKEMKNEKITKALEEIPVNIRIDPTIKSPAEYSPKGAPKNPNTIALRDPDISISAVREDVFHAYQDRFYAEGIYPYREDLGKSSVEFEAKVFCDIANCLKDKDPYISSITVNSNDVNATEKYISWMFGLTHGLDNSKPIDIILLYDKYNEMIGYFHENSSTSGYNTSTTPNVIFQALVEALTK